MNVTTIGFPSSTPALPGAGADAGILGGGFAGMLGGPVPVQGIAGAPAVATPSLPAPVLVAQTDASLLPIIDAAAATQRLPGDKPQVAMAQLLATAAPSAVLTPPAPAGGNPLADAIAQVLAKPATPTIAQPVVDTASLPAAASAAVAEAAPQPATSPAATADAAPLPASDALPNASTPAKTPTHQPLLSAKRAVVPAPGAVQLIPVPMPNADGTVPVIPTPADPQLVALKPKDSASPDADKTKAAGNATQKGASADAAPDLAGALLLAPDAAVATQIPPQAQLAQQALAPVVQGTTDSKQAPAAGTTVTAKPARGGTPDLALPRTDASPADAPGTEIASAIAARAQSESKDGGDKGDGAASFGQQLATDAPRAAPMAATHASFAGMVANASPTAPTSRPAPAAATAAEPVIQGRPGELGRSLGVEIARKVEAGEDTLRVRLNPAELGRVEVTLAFDRDGRMQATMRAESQHTLDLLRQDAPDLGRALQQAGIRNDTQSFRFEGRDSGTGSGNGQSAFQQQSRGGNQQFRDEPEPQAAAYRPIRGDGQVDLIA